MDFLIQFFSKNLERENIILLLFFLSLYEKSFHTFL